MKYNHTEQRVDLPVEDIPNLIEKPAPHANTGAYDTPFSGVGIPLLPLGIPPGHSRAVIHEVGFLEDNNDWNFPGLYSPFWRLFYDMAEGHTVVVDKKQVKTGPGHWVIVPSYVRFDAVGDVSVPSMWLHFSSSIPWPQGMSVPLLLPMSELEQEYTNRFREAYTEAEATGETDRITMIGHAMVLSALSRPEFRLPKPMHSKHQLLISHLESHLGEKLSVPEIASAMGMGVSTLHRFVKQHTGHTLVEFFNRLRVRHAANMLTSGNCEIETIAEYLGFGDRAYFSRVFKRHCGQSPAGFRNQYGIAKDKKRQNKTQTRSNTP